MILIRIWRYMKKWGLEGVTSCPSADDVQQGRQTPLFPAYQPLQLEIHTIFPECRFLPAKVRRFVEYMKEELGQARGLGDK